MTSDNPYTVDPDLIGLTFDQLLSMFRDTRQALRNHLRGGMTNAELYAATLPECKPNE